MGFFLKKWDLFGREEIFFCARMIFVYIYRVESRQVTHTLACLLACLDLDLGPQIAENCEF